MQRFVISVAISMALTLFFFCPEASAGLNQWTSIGPEGGAIKVISIDPSTPTTIYTGTLDGGVYKSTNSGDNWSQVNTGITDHEVRAITIDPSTPTTIYVGTWGEGIYKSTNGGGSWSQINTGLTNLSVWALVIDPSTPTTLYAGTFGYGVYKSTDGGGSWSQINTGLTNLTVWALVIDPSTPTTLYAGTSGGVYKSINGGGSWSQIGPTSSAVNSIAIDPSTPTKIYAGTFGYGVYKSTDGGGSWSQINSGLNSSGVISIAIDPSTPTTIYAGNSYAGVYKSTNGGGSWSQLDTGMANTECYALAIDQSTPTKIYAGTSRKGIYKSINSGGSWSQINSGLTSLSVFSLAIDPSTPNTLYAGTSYAGIYKSTDGGGNWSQLDTGMLMLGETLSIAIDPSTPTTTYAGNLGGVCKSTDGGENWSQINTGLTNTYVYALAIDPSTPTTIYAGTYGGVHKSTNGGENWSQINTNTWVNALAIDPSTPTTIYAGTMGGGIYKSTNGGENWSQINTGLTNTWVYAIAIDPSTPTTIYAGTQGVYKSTNGGENWEQINNDLTYTFINTIIIDPSTPTTLYVRTSAGEKGQGVYKSTNSGDNWSLINTGLTNTIIHVVAIDPSTPTVIYAGTQGGGVFEWSSSYTTNLTLSWSQVAGAVSYQLLIDNDSQFHSPEVNKAYLSTETSSENFANYLPDGTYYWRVDAKMANGTTVTGTVKQFAYQLPVSPAPVWVPLYRMYKGEDRDHFYTTNPSERAKAITDMGFKDEKIAGFISNTRFSDSDAATLFRLYNGATKTHVYTTSDVTRDDYIANKGFAYEGIAGFGYTTKVAGSTPLYHMYHVANTDNLYTISQTEKDNARATYGFTDQGITIYIRRNATGAPTVARNTIDQGGADLGTGNFMPFFNHVDLGNAPGKGIPFVFTRTYNLFNIGETSPLGEGWDHSYNITLVEDANNASIKWGDGNLENYTWSTDTNSFKAEAGVFNQLQKTANGYTLTTPDKTLYEFAKDPITTTIRLDAISDRNDNVLNISYDANGNIDKVTDSANRVYTFGYDHMPTMFPQGDSGFTETNAYRLSQISESTPTGLGRTVRFSYNMYGHLVKSIDPEQNQTQYAYLQPDLPLLNMVIFPRGNIMSVNYDTLNGTNRLTSYTIDQATTRFAYNIPNPATPTIQQTIVTRDNAGGKNLNDSYCNHDLTDYTASSWAPSVTGSNPTIVVARNADRIPTQVRDANNQDWKYEYNNTKGNLTKVTLPTGEVTIYEYDPNDPNLLTRVLQPSAGQAGFIETRYYYDAKGNLQRVAQVEDVAGTPVERITRIERYPNGQVWKVTDPRNNMTTYGYDAYGYPATMTDPNGKTVTYTYDAGGRMIGMRDADNVSMSFTYDKNNHLINTTDSTGKVTIRSYDANGNLKSIIDPRPVTTTYPDYNDADQPLNIFQGGTQLVAYGYDELGRMTSLKDARQIANGKTNVWQYQFNTKNQIEKFTTPLGRYDSYTYTPTGQVYQLITRDSHTITYGYDISDRIKNVNVQAGAGYAYNYASGKLGSVIWTRSGITRQTSFAYDSMGRISSVTDPTGKMVSYTYDEAGNIATITYPGSKTVIYGYDPANRLRTVKDWLNRTTTYSYSDAGRLKIIAYPSGASIEYLYDAYGRLQTVNNKKSDGSLIVGQTVDSFDALNNPEQISKIGGMNPSAVTSDSGTITTDDNNQIQASAVASYDHNLLGERISRVKGGVTTNYQWYSNEDLPGRLKGISSPSQNTTYAYDALGNRISAIRSGVTTNYILNLNASMPSIIAEANADGAITSYYIQGIGLISWIDAISNDIRYYHYDRTGNTLALTDAVGNVTDQYAYDLDPFGSNITHQGASANPFTFVGQYGVMDEGDNLFFMRARYYDAAEGKFLNEDPLRFEGGDLNLYAYVEGNPIRGIDPMGLSLSLGDGVDTYLNELRISETGNRLIQEIENSKELVNISFTNNDLSRYGGAVYSISSNTIQLNKSQLSGNNIAVAIGHELIHAYHDITNTYGTSIKEEESRTVGLWQYTLGTFTENRIRRDLGLPFRLAYSKSVWTEWKIFGALPWLRVKTFNEIY